MIKPYMISYDLDTPGQKYDELFSAIKQFGGSYIKLQDSFWLVRNNLTPSEMCEKLSPVLDGNDELFICELQKKIGSSFESQSLGLDTNSGMVPLIVSWRSLLPLIAWNAFLISSGVAFDI